MLGTASNIPSRGCLFDIPARHACRPLSPVRIRLSLLVSSSLRPAVLARKPLRHRLPTAAPPLPAVHPRGPVHRRVLPSLPARFPVPQGGGPFHIKTRWRAPAAARETPSHLPYQALRICPSAASTSRHDQTNPASSLLERPENRHMIRWDPAGEHIIVERPEQLALHVLPSVYRQSRFASFSQQLNVSISFFLLYAVRRCPSWFPATLTFFLACLRSMASCARSTFETWTRRLTTPALALGVSGMPAVFPLSTLTLPLLSSASHSQPPLATRGRRELQASRPPASPQTPQEQLQCPPDTTTALCNWYGCPPLLYARR